MIIRKKTISIILAFMMLFAFAPPAFASADDTAGDNTETAGVSMEEQASAGTNAGNGQVSLMDTGEGEQSFNIEDYEFTLSQDKFFYNGEPQRPEVLCEGLPEEAYNVEYEIDRVGGFDEGVYEVYISGNAAAGYSGNVTMSYQIVQTTVALNKVSATLYRKGTVQLKATVHEPNGKTTWTSSNTKVATVSSTGKVTAKAKRTAAIKALNANPW